jgi:hypothetical protein
MTFCEGHMADASVRIPPWMILAGLGSLERKDLCDLLAVFEDATLLRIVRDRLRDIVRRRSSTDDLGADPAFRKRLSSTSNAICSSGEPICVLRFRLWSAMRAAFDLEPAIPLSTRIANFRAADLAQHAANEVRDAINVDQEEKSWAAIPRQLWSRVERLFSRERADFSTVVGVHAARMLAKAAQEGTLDAKAKADLLEQIRAKLEETPEELRDEAVEQALKSGDIAALTLLTSGTSLVGLGVAVELAGFSAYILAAKASALIPLLGGKAAVSGLFILSNPLFIVPALLGGGYIAREHLERSIQTKLSSSLAIQMALTGLSNGKIGLQNCLDDFKSLTGDDIAKVSELLSQQHRERLPLIREWLGSPIPATPRRPEESLNKLVDGSAKDELEQILFHGRKGEAEEALAVGGLSLADIVYDAAAIDPLVIAAADFSRAEDITDVFKFGAFADRLKNMPDVAIAGAENNLKGYVAEQVVAARLVEQGYQVSLPETANNPGFDLIVDGHPFQVKCLSDIDGLVAHFEKYPKIPAFVNSELSGSIQGSDYDWVDSVFFVEGYDSDAIKQVMDAAIGAGASLDDLDVPFFAVAVSAARNIHAWWKGSLPLQDVPFEMAVDGVLNGGLAAAGGFTGSALGLLIFGPAGAVIFSGVGGASALLGKGWLRQGLDRTLRDEWLGKLDEKSEPLLTALENAMRCKIDILLHKVQQLDSFDSEHVPWLKQRFFDDALAIAECAAEIKIVASKYGQPDRSIAYFRLMTEASVHPWSVQSELKGLFDQMSRKPSLSDIAKEGFDAASDFADEVYTKWFGSGENRK